MALSLLLSGLFHLPNPLPKNVKIPSTPSKNNVGFVGPSCDSQPLPPPQLQCCNRTTPKVNFFLDAPSLHVHAPISINIAIGGLGRTPLPDNIFGRGCPHATSYAHPCVLNHQHVLHQHQHLHLHDDSLLQHNFFPRALLFHIVFRSYLLPHTSQLKNAGEKGEET